MTELFKKMVGFTDIHFGLRNDSREHNITCEKFIEWLIEEAKAYGAETCIFLGDWHNNRAKINVSTLNYSISNIEKLAKAFENFYFIPGNHDLYYRDKREINSMEFGRLAENVHIISDPIIIDDVALVPWLNGDEWKKIKKFKCKYMFGHFELPHFKMNAMIEMPDHGGIHANDLSNPDYVFSGHFHKRQQKDNIVYMGNCFPHSFSDEGDTERGMMFLEWGKKPEFKSWPDAPKYTKVSLSKLLEAPEDYIDDQTHLRVEMDIDVSYEDVTYIKEELIKEFNPKELTLIVNQDDEEHLIDFGGELDFESVDSVVLSHLKTIESQNIDNSLLANIYKSL